MNFTQMHERLRVELLRRIQRGTLTVSLLARQTGFGQPHLSNFLHSKRNLSLEALDRILTAQHLAAGDLMSAGIQPELLPMDENVSSIPVVSHGAAFTEPFIRPGSVHSMLHLPAGALQSVRARASSARRTWQRFVAVRIASADASPMDPVIQPDALVVIDRHYNVLAPYRPHRTNLFAVRHGSHLVVRYLECAANRLLLRPQIISHPVDLIEIEPGMSPSEFIAGRVIFILNET